MIKYKYTLDDFDVVRTNIPKDHDKTYMDSDTFPKVPGYEVYKLEKILWFKKKHRPYMPYIRREKLEDVAIWLNTETGAPINEILKKLRGE